MQSIADYRITPKSVTSLRCPSPLHKPGQHSYLRRCWSVCEPVAMLCKVWPFFGIRTLHLPHMRYAR